MHVLNFVIYFSITLVLFYAAYHNNYIFIYRYLPMILNFHLYHMIIVLFVHLLQDAVDFMEVPCDLDFGIEELQEV